MKPNTSNLIPFSEVFDPKNLVNKFSKYLELINTKRTISYLPSEEVFICKNATSSFIPPTLEKLYEWESININNSYSFGQTRNNWFAFKGLLKIPKQFNEKKHLIRVVFHIDRNYLVRQWDDDTPAGPEGRFWINSKPISAIDEFHDGAFIKEIGLFECRIFTGRCLSNHSLSRFGIEIIDKNTESLYQRIRFLISILKELKPENSDKNVLIRIIDTSLRLLDIRELNYPIELHEIRQNDINSNLFYSSVENSLNKLKELIYSLPKNLNINLDPTISIIGYSHLDTCWLWPFKLSHFKSINTTTTMLHLLENPPHEFINNDVKWKFLATAGQHYKWMKNDDPELFSRVIQTAKNGRWDVNGVMWLEPDTTLPSGESLVRQILMGIKMMEKEMGFKQSVLFLPDCFGFSGSLPQIMLLANIDSFITSKISWSEYTEFPYSTFKWKGIDGSEILSHFISTPSQWSYQTSTYTGVASSREMIGTYDQYKQKDILRNSALHTVGNGDGGGGVTDEMLWNLNLMNELPKLNGVPKVIFPSLDELFIEIRNKKDLLPTWDDELYLEYHRGTLTTQEEIKRQNRLLESHLHNCEFLLTLNYSLLNLEPSKYKSLIDKIWEDTLLFQFHDCLPGTSVNEANLETLSRGQLLLKEIENIENELSELFSNSINSNSYIIFNSLSFNRVFNNVKINSYGWTTLNDLPLYDNIITTFYERTLDNNYKIHEIQTNFIDTLISDSINDSNINFNEKDLIVQTPLLRIQFNKNGLIQSIIDNNNREFINKESNIFELYEDRPINWPAWDIQLYHKEMQLNGIIELISMTWKTNSIENKWKINNSILTQIITFSSNEPFIDFKTIINWKEHDKLLKVNFSSTIRSKFARYGIQFGNLQRPTHTNTDKDMAKFEVSGRWGDLSDSTGGITLLSNIKSGFDIHGNNIKMSLLKSPMQTDRWADYGIRKFSYRLLIHSKSFEQSNIQNLSDDLIIPPIISKNKNSNNINNLINNSFINCENNSIIIDTLKISENNKGFIIRLYESIGGWVNSIINLPLLNINEWNIFKVNLKEEIIENLYFNNNSFNIILKPFEIVTIYLEKKN